MARREHAPLFYLAVIFYLWRDGLGPRYWLGDAPGISYANIAATILFVNSISPYWINSVVPGGWTVAIEMVFYACMPIARRIRDLNCTLWVMLASLAMYYVLLYLLVKHPLISSVRLWNEFLELWFPAQLPIFCLGILLFFLIEGDRTVSSNFLFVAPILFMGCLSVGYGYLTNFFFGLAFLLFAYGLSMRPLRILVNPATIYLGRISYSCYLVHFAVLPLVVGHAGFIMTYLLTVVLTMLISIVTYNLVEIPGMKLGNMFISRVHR